MLKIGSLSENSNCLSSILNSLESSSKTATIPSCPLVVRPEGLPKPLLSPWLSGLSPFIAPSTVYYCLGYSPTLLWPGIVGSSVLLAPFSKARSNMSVSDSRFAKPLILAPAGCCMLIDSIHKHNVLMTFAEYWKSCCDSAVMMLTGFHIFGASPAAEGHA
jgi:hypothetical protein